MSMERNYGYNGIVFLVFAGTSFKSLGQGMLFPSKKNTFNKIQLVNAENQQSLDGVKYSVKSHDGKLGKEGDTDENGEIQILVPKKPRCYDVEFIVEGEIVKFTGEDGFF